MKTSNYLSISPSLSRIGRMIGKKHTGFYDYVTIEVTTFCNQNCKFCLHNELTTKKIRPIKNINRKDFIKILEWIYYDLKITEPLISPCGMGETLMHPDIQELIKDMRNVMPNSIIDITTNGWLLDDWIIDSPIDMVHISLNHVDEFRYQEFSGRPINDLKEKIKSFMKEREYGLPGVTIQLVDEAPLRDGLRFIQEFKPYMSNYDSLKRVSDIGFDSWGEWIKSGKTCRGMNLNVDIDGNVYPCCMGREINPRVSTNYPDKRVCIGKVGDSKEDLNLQLRTLKYTQKEGINDLCCTCPIYINS
jgi:sulfatase maturation enzyme AslB (radical SAM superfamily)